jgi:hypothetical protein
MLSSGDAQKRQLCADPAAANSPAVRRAESALGSFSGGQAQSRPHQATVRASTGPFPAAAMTYRALRPSKPAAVAALSPVGGRLSDVPLRRKPILNALINEYPRAA